jgi:GDP-4-dehydro-6-deoxy-D-mannose reductase
MTRRVLITGITGFVGSHLADLALEHGDIELWGLRRWNLSRLRNVRHIVDRVRWFDCDITDPVSTARMIKQVMPDRIFHMAAESFVSPSWDHPSHWMDVNYKGTVNLLEAMRAAGSDARIHLPGSGEEYGEIHEHELPITEATPLRPVNPYAVTKVAQDLIGYVYFRSYGTKVVRTRAFNHEGPRRDHVFGISSYAYQIARIEAGQRPPVVEVGHIEDRRNFTHIRDMVEAYWLAMEHCEPGELYLIGTEMPGNVHTFREALQDLIAMSTVKGITFRTKPEYVRPTNVPRLIADTGRFEKLTGWKAKIPYERILSDTLEYWRQFVREGLY